MAFSINDINLKKFNLNLDDVLYRVKKFNVEKDGVTTTVWRDILDIYPNSDIAWTVEPASEIGGYEEYEEGKHIPIDINDPLGTFAVTKGSEDTTFTGYCRSSAIDVSDYETLTWKGECSSSCPTDDVYGYTWVYLYGGTEEGKDDVFRVILGEKAWRGVNKTFDEPIDITGVNTLYLTVQVKVEPTTQWGVRQNVFTESIVAKKE